MFSSKEQLLYYLIFGHVHLSKKDYGFFNNITNSCKENRPITSNQNKLFDKLLLKYKRQLTKLNHNIEILQRLEWKVGIVESKPEFLYAKISTNNFIKIKAPFNSQFIQKFRNIENNRFIWIKDKKCYAAPFTTYNLKLAVTYVNKYYKEVVYCDNTTKILEELKVYDNAKYWHPTLIKNNNNFYIYGINENLYEATKNIELNDDPKTLFELSKYGITIDSSVTNGDNILELAGKYDVTIDLEYLDTFCSLLKKLQVEHVFTVRDIVYNKEISNEIKLMMLQHGISCSPITSSDRDVGVLIKGNNSYIAYNPKRIDKMITLTNSRPIKVR